METIKTESGLIIMFSFNLVACLLKFIKNIISGQSLGDGSQLWLHIGSYRVLEEPAAWFTPPESLIELAFGGNQACQDF